MLSTSPSHHPVACVVDTKYINELVRGIRFPAKPAGLKHYVGILSTHLQCELFTSIFDNVIVMR